MASDNPLVMYNQLMEFQDFESGTGLASRGLQIFFPLSPRFMVHLFDKHVYAVHPRGAAHMKIAQKADIDSLNALQAVSAMENIYFKGPRADVYRVVELGARFRRTRKARVFQAGNDSLDTKKSTLIGFSQVDIKTNLNLSFIRVLKPAKRWREALRSKRYRPTVVLRNPDFFKSHEQFLAAVNVGNYQPTEFRRFLRDSK